MPKELFAIFIKNPFKSTPFIFAYDGNSYFCIQDIIDIFNYELIISFGMEEAIDKIRTLNNKSDFYVIDIVLMKKLCLGKPKREYKKSPPWTLTNIIGKYLDSQTITWVKKIQNMSLIDPINSESIDVNTKNLLLAFKKSYDELVNDLNNKNESERFNQIEAPIYNIFLNTQLSGIHVSHDILNNRINELKINYYSSIKELEFKYNFSSHLITYKMDWEDISAYCKLFEFKNDFNYKFWDTVELFKDHDRFLLLLHQAKTSYSDYNELLKYKIDNHYRIYPTFDIAGTVTSRILITKPGIQYLSKNNREIFIPQDGKCFIYADFDQFEPGILASFSNDQKFIHLYNNKDVYSELSKILFGTVNQRKKAKIIFLSFMYGMKNENISKLIRKLSPEVSADKLKEFFDVFSEIDKWKHNLICVSEIIGFVSSCFGNSRYLMSKGKSSNFEKRWIPNQFIQGTASYIFKKSLIELNNHSKFVSFLIPMHDAILVETPKDKADTVKGFINEIFNKNFTEICPNIKTSISFEEFSA